MRVIIQTLPQALPRAAIETATERQKRLRQVHENIGEHHHPPTFRPLTLLLTPPPQRRNWWRGVRSSRTECGWVVVKNKSSEE